VSDEDGYLAYVNVSAPSTSPSPNTAGTPAGTANATVSGTDRCERRTDDTGTRGAAAATVPYANEADLLNDDAKLQNDPLVPFALGSEAARPASPFENIWRDLCGNIFTEESCDFSDSGLGDQREPPVDMPWSEIVGDGAPNNFGIDQVDFLVDGNVHPDGLWSSTLANYVDEYRNGLGPRPVYYTTVYGYVSPAAVSAYSLSLPKGATTGTYGSHACASIGPGAPVQNGWDCDPTHWYLDPAGTDIEPRSTSLGEGADGNGVPYGARPGHPYNMRDIDCYDESLQGARELGLHWGVLTGTSCLTTP
jgi:hypothetical protein